MEENEDRENLHNLNFTFSHFKPVLYAQNETLVWTLLWSRTLTLRK